jgi:hypothetical protein
MPRLLKNAGLHPGILRRKDNSYAFCARTYGLWYREKTCFKRVGTDCHFGRAALRRLARFVQGIGD